MAMGLLTEVLDMEPSEFLAALRDKVGPGGLAEWHRLAAVLEEFGPMTDADGDDAGRPLTRRAWGWLKPAGGMFRALERLPIEAA